MDTPPEPTACCQCHTNNSCAHVTESIFCVQCIYAAAYEKKTTGQESTETCPLPKTATGCALCCCVPPECIGFFCIREPSLTAFIAECFPILCCFGGVCAMNDYRKGNARIKM